MAEESPARKSKIRSFASRLGATEWLLILGVSLLACGLYPNFSWYGILISAGIGLMVIASVNALQEQA